MIDKTHDRWTALLLAGHIVLLFAGFTILAAVFDFPEVLRLPAPERLALFQDGQSVIMPTYWMLAMTGITQVLLTVLLWRTLGPAAGTAATLALVFGILTGFGQAMGFGRWAILIPWLAERMADPSTTEAGHEAIALMEGAFNRYAGMLVGEHLSNICWGFWLFFTGLTVRRSGVLDARIGRAMMALSPLMFILAAEQLGFEGPILGLLTDFGFPLLALVHFALAWQILRRPEGAAAQPLGIGAGVAGVVLYVAMIWPAIAG
ncbi:DUF4386 family protein [Parvibaculum sp.]|uniref:DUF4386 family protein n=1 Tax=Parvibaculum sp. TaxID=2024848 RepID=UPI001D3F178C|nr:DUF4386 family protein [Parvibaculum sp.]MBX3487807.1 DUF4386 family protein [Parvibaculum sp.]MCW5729044.1 DUF4386 family protein [Parvibaculum sp.]